MSSLHLKLPPFETFCAFCSAPEPGRFYDLLDPLIFEINGLLIDTGRLWAACDVCGELVDQKRIEELVDRTVATDVFADVFPKSAEVAAQIRAMYLAQYERLKEGPCIRIK